MNKKIYTCESGGSFIEVENEEDLRFSVTVEMGGYDYGKINLSKEEAKKLADALLKALEESNNE